MEKDIREKVHKLKSDPERWNTWVRLKLAKTNGRIPTYEIVSLMEEVYHEGYDKDSRCDGCTVVSELDWPKGGKHPACVGHDYLYMTGRYSRLHADMWMLRCNIQMGHRFRGWIRFFGVRLLGHRAWKKHRQRDE